MNVEQEIFESLDIQVLETFLNWTCYKRFLYISRNSNN